MHSEPLSLTSNSEILTTINVNDLPSDLITMLGGQVNYCVTDFLDSAGPAHRIIVFLFLHNRIVLHLSQAGLPV